MTAVEKFVFVHTMSNDLSLDNLLLSINTIPYSFFLQKFSKETLYKDFGISRSKLDPKKLWRCRIHKKGSWHYSETPQGALQLAMDEYLSRLTD